MFRSAFRCGALGCVLVSAFASVAGAQLLNHKDLSASIAITIAQTTIETCKANGYAVSATVVGRNGEILAQVRGDNTGPTHYREQLPQGLYRAHFPRAVGRPGRSAEG
jgi:Haem degrading protein HbpS-like